jgi:hypothetical protein
VSRPQVIDDQEHERVHDRVAAIDVAKDTGMVCTRAPHPSRPGARRSTVWTVKARMGAIRGLGRQLKRDGIEVVTLEATSDYWRIWFFVLEACGLAVQLVNAAQAKNLPGRSKTDRLTELTAAVDQVSGRVGVLVASVAGHEYRRRWTAGSVPAGGAAARVAGVDRGCVRAVPAGRCGGDGRWRGWPRSPASARTWPAQSSPRPAWT